MAPDEKPTPTTPTTPSAGSGELMCERHQGADDVRRLPSRPISHNSSGELALGLVPGGRAAVLAPLGLGRMPEQQHAAVEPLGDADEDVAEVADLVTVVLVTAVELRDVVEDHEPRLVALARGDDGLHERLELRILADRVGHERVLAPDAALDVQLAQVG